MRAEKNVEAFLNADQYAPGTRIASKFTRRQGTVAEWPRGKLPIVGAVYVKWDDRTEGHAWRHQVNRI